MEQENDAAVEKLRMALRKVQTDQQVACDRATTEKHRQLYTDLCTLLDADNLKAVQWRLEERLLTARLSGSEYGANHALAELEGSQDLQDRQMAEALNHLIRMNEELFPPPPPTPPPPPPHSGLASANPGATILSLLRPLLLDRSFSRLSAVTLHIQRSIMFERLQQVGTLQLCAHSFHIFRRLLLPLRNLTGDTGTLNYRLLRLIHCWYQALKKGRLDGESMEFSQAFPFYSKEVATEWRKTQMLLTADDRCDTVDIIIIVSADLSILFKKLRDTSNTIAMKGEKGWLGVFERHRQAIMHPNSASISDCDSTHDPFVIEDLRECLNR